ncbi:Uncharacterized phage-encoded protein-like [uncultured Pleomorphomonas sp.]|uniref:Uncharacterized phage-encoded protein-like n=1 Tax=uncultured Pleomorphomonas sp. TaxID=442121 RepID=A0A212L1W6_9HYPH|nr:phage regulatory protein/antirepressor Ant [uncultured Pleomorphomonas sp.]SCM71530.1 Uncharacterized phage-encoded protein-like [uncultured Pleomorphomonas sp.]
MNNPDQSNLNLALSPSGIDATRQPVVFARDGEVFANSRDVAAAFEKRHADVLRDIDNLIQKEPELGLRNFAHAPYKLQSTGEQLHRSFDMDRRAFSVLAMGFTGAKALKWKLRYIDAFEAMEAELRSRPAVDPMQVLNDPAAMRGLLLTYTEKVLALEEKVGEMKADVDALDRIAKSDGSLCITDAAKTLQVQPKALFRFLQSFNWIYTRAGTNTYIAYQSKLAAGLLEHKTTTVERSDGSEKTVTQVRVTPKGLARLAREFPPAVRAA